MLAQPRFFQLEGIVELPQWSDLQIDYLILHGYHAFPRRLTSIHATTPTVRLALADKS